MTDEKPKKRLYRMFIAIIFLFLVMISWGYMIGGIAVAILVAGSLLLSFSLTGGAKESIYLRIDGKKVENQ